MNVEEILTQCELKDLEYSMSELSDFAFEKNLSSYLRISGTFHYLRRFKYIHPNMNIGELILWLVNNCLKFKPTSHALDKLVRES